MSENELSIPPDEPTESRSVEVHEPGLSESTNEMLTADARAAIGADTVEVPSGRRHPSTGESVEHDRRGLPLPFSLPRDFALTQVGAGLTVVAAVAALAAGVHQWWALALAVVVLLAMTYLVVSAILGMIAHSERPSPTSVAAMEADGLTNPEEYFSDVVAEFTPRSGPVSRSAAVEEHPRLALAEQRAATTRSRPEDPAGPKS